MMQTSSSRRETRSENRHGLKKNVGCMSGIFHLLSRHHHNRSRKRLPSARKKEETVISLPLPEKRPPTVPQANEGKKRETSRAITPEKAVVVPELRRHSCEVPRSPTLPPEIRRSISTASPDSPRRPPALVARLMGLEDVPVSSPESAAEKRRKLLGALEKCDEDLKALKRIIEAVRFAEVRVKAVAAVGSVEQITVGAVKGLAGLQDLDSGDSRIEEEAKCSEINGEQPSPVSVLDAISSPRYRSKRPDNEKQCGSTIAAVGSKIVKPLRTSVFSLGDGRQYKKLRVSDESCSFFHRIATEGLPRLSEWKDGKVVEDSGVARRRLEGGQRRWWQRRTQAMVDSVGEVWEDGVWEERWELGRVGVGLEGYIFGDLVEEVVMDLLGCCFNLSLPFGTCKKRLCF
ncbi:uncharacterized protein LOC120107997 [Phoenix dactylifera]|uniref:Uncharacterized protein LOC120107997 n=1 Tax=Phoenix dactylifera TaxID=42345 RepID=A0A8B8ZVQ5_PHODC|nr:uncharacterized protein LOC120107997 [Phoenix dactylifera]